MFCGEIILLRFNVCLGFMKVGVFRIILYWVFFGGEGDVVFLLFFINVLFRLMVF